MNSIVNLKTVNTDSPSGAIPVIVMGLNIDDLDSADEFILEAAEKFKLQRMCSPPTTSAMLITVVTAMPIAQFVSRWRQISSEDEILGFFMSQMRRADVMRGTTVGVALETASLVGSVA